MNTPREPHRPAPLDVPADVQQENQTGNGNSAIPPYRSIIVIGSVLMAWACFLAVGAIWASDNYLKAIVIVGSMGCFLSVWITALWLKKRPAGLRNSDPG